MKKRILSLLVALTMTFGVQVYMPVSAATAKEPQYQANARIMERLNRGLIAVRTYTSAQNGVQNGVYLSWRLLGTESLSNQAFDIYRNDVKIYTTGVHDATCYVDTAGTENDVYKVVKAGASTLEVNSEIGVKAFTVHNKTARNSLAGNGTSRPNSFSYVDIPLSRPANVTNHGGGTSTYYGNGGANDASLGDIDGDGDYEFILKWTPSDAKDSASGGYTGNVYIDAYEISENNGGYKWRIDLGKNICAGAHYTQFIVYDFDNDGKSEIAMKTAPGSKDGTGRYVTEVGDTSEIRNADNSAVYLNDRGVQASGGEYITIFDGETGRALKTTSGIPIGDVNSWGDNYYNRSERYLAAVAYIDGVNPHFIECRGYYAKAIVRAYKWDGTNLTKVWEHDGSSNSSSTIYGQGNHNLSVADIDNDGKDEIVYGSAALDDNGKVMGNTRLWHGDAMHVSDFNNDGVQEVFSVKEDSAGYTNNAADFRVASTGKNIFGVGAGGDTGRGVMANVDDEYAKTHPNALAIGWTSSHGESFDLTGATVAARPNTSSRMMTNFLVYWDGDLSREMLDDNQLAKYDAANGWTLRFYNDGDGYMPGTSINGSKQNPALVADLWGDWREEIIMPTGTGEGETPYLRILTSTIPTNYRLTTLMHDCQYRMAIAWQNVGYNQPPHQSYYIGSAALATDSNGNTLNYLAPAVPFTRVAYVDDGAESNKAAKEITYILKDASGNEIDRWTDGPRYFEIGAVAYNYPAGEVYAAVNGKAYIVKSATEQKYVVADDNSYSHTVTLEVVHKNAVLNDTFADVDGKNNNGSTDMLFVGSAGVSDADDTDADGNATVTGEGWNLSNPRVPLLTFNVPEDYEKGKAVKLNVYVQTAHGNLIGGNSMKLAANSVDLTVNESTGYDTDNIANLSNLVWSDSMFRLPTGSNSSVNAWVSIDVTEFVQNATGDTVTFALYAPKAGAYIADRESASGGGAYMGKAAYLEVQDGETIVATGMEKVTKLGSAVKNPVSFVVPVNSTVKFYAPSNVGAYAVTNGEDIYTLTNNATGAINPVAGSYYLKKLEGDVIYSTAGVDEGFVTTSHGPITKGIIDMDFVPFASKDAVIAISSSTSNPTWFGQSNLQINFTPEGEIQAFNGAALDTTSSVEYEVGKKYHLHIETDVLADTYSAWITDEDGNEYTLALNYTYRVTGAEDLGKLLVIGGWKVEAGSLAVSNVQFKNATTKTVTYTINDADGVYKTWTDGPKQFALDEVLYNFPQGEFYYEMDGKAYILSSEAAQSYTVANDSNDVHNVTLTLVHENAVLADTFADTNGNVQDESTDLLFTGSAGVSDASDTDADGNATVTGSGYSLGSARIPLLTFNVPDDYTEGKAVKLNVYVVRANGNLGGGNSMKLAANAADLTVNESAGYAVDSVVDLSNLVWSDAMFRLPTGSGTNVDTWVSIDVTEFVQNAEGDKVTFALYAPRAGAYVADRETASAGGANMGKAAYLEVQDGETIVATGMEKVTKLGSVIQNPTRFVVPVNATVKFYASEDAYAVANGTDKYALTNNVTEAINPVEGNYYAVKFDENSIFSTDGTNEGFVTTSHGPMVNGVIDMDLIPLEFNDNVVGITSSASTPTWYSSFNIQINFTPDGYIKAYNLSGLSGDGVSYKVGEKYHLHIETNVQTATYNAWITDEDGNEYVLATNYAYRDKGLEANDLGKLTVIGGGGIAGGKLVASNVVFENALMKTVTYTINDADGVYKTWTVGPKQFALDEVLYDFPQGEFYCEMDGKAYILSSDAVQSYTVANDSNDVHNVTLTLVHENAVLKDTFANIDGTADANNTDDLLFIGSAGVSDIADVDADNVSTVSDSCRYVGNPRIPMLTFNVPVVEEGKAVKLNVYVAKANDTFFREEEAVSMRLAAGVADVAVDEAVGYDVDNYADITNIVWSDNAITHSGAVTWDSSGKRGIIGQWITIDVTEYVNATEGDTITFTLYAPKAGVYVADREKTVAGGEYEGKAAYLEVVDAYTVEVTGATKLTKMGNVVSGESVIVPVGSTIKLYEESEKLVAFTDGTKVYRTSDDTGETPYITINADTELTAATVGVAPVDGAQVRIGDGVNESGKVDGTNSGLRFITTVDYIQSLANVEGATFGVRVTAEGSEEYVDIATANDKWQSETVFTSALTNLAVGNFNRKFTATPYVIADGQTFYGESVTRSIYQVAAGLLVNDSTDGTDYDNEAIASSVLYKVLNAYVNQTGIRLSFTSAGLTEYTGTGTSAYSGSQFFEVVSAETAGDNVYSITIKPLGAKTIIASYWQEYIRINNNNSKIAEYTSMVKNEDGSVTITFDYAAYLNQ